MKNFIVIAFLIPALNGVAQFNSIKPHELSADFGSLRNRYLFPITNISYSSRDFTSLHLVVGGRLRSYGTLYFFSNSAYDLTPQAEIILSPGKKNLFFTAGFGADIRLRIVKDVRSNAVTSAEPLIILSANYHNRKFVASLPFWNRYYSNGISFSVMPQFKFRLNERWGIYSRYEISLLKLYQYGTEWRRDCFLGLSMEF